MPKWNEELRKTDNKLSVQAYDLNLIIKNIKDVIVKEEEVSVLTLEILEGKHKGEEIPLFLNPKNFNQKWQAVLLLKACGLTKKDAEGVIHHDPDRFYELKDMCLSADYIQNGNYLNLKNFREYGTPFKKQEETPKEEGKKHTDFNQEIADLSEVPL